MSNLKKDSSYKLKMENSKRKRDSPYRVVTIKKKKPENEITPNSSLPKSLIAIKVEDNQCNKDANYNVPALQKSVIMNVPFGKKKKSDIPINRKTHPCCSNTKDGLLLLDQEQRDELRERLFKSQAGIDLSQIVRELTDNAILYNKQFPLTETEIFCIYQHYIVEIISGGYVDQDFDKLLKPAPHQKQIKPWSNVEGVVTLKTDEQKQLMNVFSKHQYNSKLEQIVQLSYCEEDINLPFTAEMYESMSKLADNLLGEVLRNIKH